MTRRKGSGRGDDDCDVDVEKYNDKTPGKTPCANLLCLRNLTVGEEALNKDRARFMKNDPFPGLCRNCRAAAVREKKEEVEAVAVRSGAVVGLSYEEHPLHIDQRA